MTLAGVRVLIPGLGALADRCAAEVRARGGIAVVEPAIATAAPEDARPLEDARVALAAGEYDWLVVTSPRAVSALALAPAAARVAARVAAVGDATAAACAAAGIAVDFVPREQSAAGLVREFAAPAGQRILLPQSAIAHSTAADGLRKLGHLVTTVTAYRTVPRPLPADLAVDAAIVTSGSVARGLGRFSGVPMVSIGPQTSAEMRAAGLVVAAEAAAPTAEALVSLVEKEF